MDDQLTQQTHHARVTTNINELRERRRKWSFDRYPEPEPPYWFSPKQYGLGWGGAKTWQGFLCLLSPIATIVPLFLWQGAIGAVVSMLVMGPAIALNLWAVAKHGDPRGRRWHWGPR